MTSSSKPPQYGDQLPYENLLQALVACIRSQPLLFLVAIGVLIISVVVVGGELGSADFRFVVSVLAGLGIVGVLGYYVLEARQMLQASRANQPADTPPDNQHDDAA